MAAYEEIKDVLSESSEDYEEGTLLDHVFRHHQKSDRSSVRRQRAYFLFLHCSNLVLLACTVMLSIHVYVTDHRDHDPSLGVYCKSNSLFGCFGFRHNKDAHANPFFCVI
jgi:hypothetical protein